MNGEIPRKPCTRCGFSTQSRAQEEAGLCADCIRADLVPLGETLERLQAQYIEAFKAYEEKARILMSTDPLPEVIAPSPSAAAALRAATVNSRDYTLQAAMRAAKGPVPLENVDEDFSI